MGISSWKSEIKSNLANIRQYQADKAAREEDIQRLEKSQREIKEARKAFRDIQKSVISATDETLFWRGNSQEQYRYHAAYIKAAYRGADTKIGEVLDQIKSDISNLKKQNNDLIQAIRGLERRNNRLNDWIADALRNDG